MEIKKFSKSTALEALDERASKIFSDQRFDRNNGTSQLSPRGASEWQLRSGQKIIEVSVLVKPWMSTS